MSDLEKLVYKLAMAVYKERTFKLRIGMANTEMLEQKVEFEKEIKNRNNRYDLFKRAFDENNVDQMRSDFDMFLKEELF